MYRSVRIACMMALSGLLIGSASCSSKGMRSGGETSAPVPSLERSERSPSGLSDSDLAGLSGIDSSNPTIAMSKVTPGERRRQQEEARAEENATSAAGLQDVYFGYDSWTISEEGRRILSRDAEWLRRNQAVRLKVEGHCDERGSSGYNFILAEKRAKAVRNYLMDLGIKGERLLVVSYGKERPFCKERSEACYQQNRRGHLVVKP
ncbi:MAG TPA: OmpA family protein [Nitrospira sp.]|nr:OmpA family protein [Nitrospira sp.]